MAKYIFIIIVLIVSSLAAIDFYPASGEFVPVRTQDSLAYYHQFTADQNWYGSTNWAVRYDFRDYFPGVPVGFNAENIWLYFPNPVSTDNVLISFYKEVVNQPDSEQLILEQNISSAQLTTGWNVIALDQTVNDSIFWVVLHYPTNETDQFLTASSGDGEHSYYESEGYYYSMSANSFNAEFLICLEGEFEIDVIDIELNDFYLSSEPEFGVEIFPVMVLENFHTATVNDIGVIYSVIAPFGSYQDTIWVPNENNSLAAGEQITLDLNGDQNYSYTIKDTAAQYRFSATIFCAEDAFAYNNSSILNYRLFTEANQHVMVENFLQLNAEVSGSVWQDQLELSNNEDIFILNNFSELTDTPFYSNSAAERFNFYELYGFPVTISGGTKKIVGYDTLNYSDSLNSHITDFLDSEETFVSSDTLKAYLNDVLNMITFQISLFNDSTYVFSSYLDECVFYAAVVEDSLSATSVITGSVLNDIRLEVSDLALGFASHDSVIFELDLDAIEPVNSLNACKLLYWLQNSETGKIEYVNSTAYFSDIEFEYITSADDEIIPEVLEVNLYPNPFSKGSELNIELDNMDRSGVVKLEIFNLKGQLIRTIWSEENERSSNLISWDGKTGGRETASGIYFIKVTVPGSGRSAVTKKCLYIKG